MLPHLDRFRERKIRQECKRQEEGKAVCHRFTNQGQDAIPLAFGCPAPPRFNSKLFEEYLHLHQLRAD